VLNKTIEIIEAKFYRKDEKPTASIKISADYLDDDDLLADLESMTQY
jgi:hypothetical protein